MEAIIFIAIFWVLPMVLNWIYGKKKNRNYLGWFILAVFFGWFSTLILAIMPKLDKPVQY